MWKKPARYSHTRWVNAGCLWWNLRQPGVPFDSQQGSELRQAVQLLGCDEGSLVASSQQVSPDVLLLQAVKKVLDLEHGAQALPLCLHLRHLLLLYHLLLGSQQLRKEPRVSVNTCHLTFKGKTIVYWFVSSIWQNQSVNINRGV